MQWYTCMYMCVTTYVLTELHMVVVQILTQGLAIAVVVSFPICPSSLSPHEYTLPLSVHTTQ